MDDRKVRTNLSPLSTYFLKLGRGWRLASWTVRFLLWQDNRREIDCAIDFYLANMWPKGTPSTDGGLWNTLNGADFVGKAERMTFNKYFFDVLRPNLAFTRLEQFAVLSLGSEGLGGRAIGCDLHCWRVMGS